MWTKLVAVVPGFTTSLVLFMADSGGGVFDKSHDEVAVSCF